MGLSPDPSLSSIFIYVLSLSLLVAPVLLWWDSVPCITPPLHTRFKSEPDFKAAVVDVSHHTNDLSRLAPGYLFFTAFFRENTWGPQIFDQNGELVWLGQHLLTGRAQAFHTCDYRGEIGKHLCFAEHIPHRGGSNRIIDNTYTPVKPVYRPKNFPGDYVLNSHEFSVVAGGHTLLQAVNALKEVDLSPFEGKVNATVLDACFQELEIDTQKDLFKWCWLDHFSIDESHGPDKSVPSNDTTWDPLHLNSVDKNPQGDYLISLRHTDQLIKIAGLNNVRGLAPGEIVWRLGANHSTFEVDGDALFAHQHHARFVDATPTTETITLFNNAYKGQNTLTGSISTGMVLQLDNDTMEAHLVKTYPHPYGGHSPGQGSMQLLPNGNALVGWGGQPEWSEFAEDGTLLSHASVSVGPINYRTSKLQWEGNPKQQPKVVAFFRDKPKLWRAPSVMAFVSWNGATKAKSWRFHLSESGPDGPWRPAGTYPKTKFETVVKLSSRSSWSQSQYIYVEALDDINAILDSTKARILGPTHKTARYCDLHYCRKLNSFRHVDNELVEETCMQNMLSVAISFTILVVVTELVAYCFAKYPALDFAEESVAL